MAWIGAIVSAVLAILKSIWGTSTLQKEVISETDQDVDLDSALGDPSRLPDPDQLQRNVRSGQRE